MENKEKEDRVALAIISIIPLIIYIAVFIWLLSITYGDRGMVAFNLCLIIGCIVAVLSGIIVIVFKFDLTKYGEQFGVSIIFFIISVVVSWFIMFETGSIALPIAVPIIVLTISCYAVSQNCEEERDPFMFFIVHPATYYTLFFLIGFILSFDFHWENLTGGY